MERTVFCTECGVENQTTAKFCYRCGASMTGGGAQAAGSGSEAPRSAAEVIVPPESVRAPETADSVDVSGKVKTPSPGPDSLTVRVNGVAVPVRQYIQDERLRGTKKETVTSKLTRELGLTQVEAGSLVDEAWDSVPRAKLAAEGVKSGVWGLFAILVIGGFFVVIGAILIGSIRTGFEALTSGQIGAAVTLFLIAIGVFLYARWAVNGK